MANDIPREERTVVYAVTGMDEVTSRRNLVYHTDGSEALLLDACLPPQVQPGSALPGVIFIHGGPVSEDWVVKDRGSIAPGAFWRPLPVLSLLPSIIVTMLQNACHSRYRM